MASVAFMVPMLCSGSPLDKISIRPSALFGCSCAVPVSGEVFDCHALVMFTMRCEVYCVSMEKNVCRSNCALAKV